jgi:hypothetical protein
MVLGYNLRYFVFYDAKKVVLSSILSLSLVKIWPSQSKLILLEIVVALFCAKTLADEDLISCTSVLSVQ